MIRKCSLITVIGLCAAASVGFAQELGKANHHLSIRVENVTSGGPEKTSANSSHSRFSGGQRDPALPSNFAATEISSVSSSLTHASSPRYKVLVSNFGSQLTEATVEWYVFARDASPRTSSTQQTHDKGTEAVKVEGRKSAEVFFQPQPIVSTSDKSVTTVTGQSIYDHNQTLSKTMGATFVSGSKFIGWLVRLKVGDEVVAVKASSPTLEEMGRTGRGL